MMAIDASENQREYAPNEVNMTPIFASTILISLWFSSSLGLDMYRNIGREEIK
jgi:hypothetical protein